MAVISEYERATTNVGITPTIDRIVIRNLIVVEKRIMPGGGALQDRKGALWYILHWQTTAGRFSRRS
jgi:hypothetical protein